MALLNKQMKHIYFEKELKILWLYKVNQCFHLLSFFLPSYLFKKKTKLSNGPVTFFAYFFKGVGFCFDFDFGFGFYTLSDYYFFIFGGELLSISSFIFFY